MMVVLQVLVFAMGLVSIFLAVKHTAFFWSTRKSVGKSMVFMLSEQIVSSACTLWFSINSLVLSLNVDFGNDWNAMDPRLAITLRMLMFGAMIHSTTHLSHSIRLILKSEKQ